MEMTIGYYVFILLGISAFGLFIICGLLGGTQEAYRDMLLTIAVTHFVMSKLITITKYEKE